MSTNILDMRIAPHLFRLRVLDENAYRSFPLHDVLRLEPTDRVRPRDGLRVGAWEIREEHSRSIGGLTTCGNNSIATNAILAVHDSGAIRGSAQINYTRFRPVWIHQTSLTSTRTSLGVP